jgi:hypothetical protein
MTAAIVAAILLVASPVGSWLSVTQILRQFDPGALIESLRELALQEILGATKNDKPAIRRCQAILSVMLTAAAKGDVEVVEDGLNAWRRILERYLERTSIVWSDPLLYWLYDRCGELCTQFAKESVGLTLPIVVRGVAALGETTASYRNQLNASFDEGTFLFATALRQVVIRSGGAPRPTAASEATAGLGAIAMACIRVEKFTTTQAPIAELRTVGLAAAPAVPDIASQVVVRLAEIILALSGSKTFDSMCPADAEEALSAMREITLAAKGKARLDPAHFLTAPMASTSLPLLCQRTARAAQESSDNAKARHWDGIANSAASLAIEILEDSTLNSSMRWNSIDAAGCVVLGLLAIPRLEPYIATIERICNTLTELATQDDGRLHALGVLDVLLRAIYTAWTATKMKELRSLLTNAAAKIEGADERQRIRMSPIARRIGAIALGCDDEELAQLMGNASLPEPETDSRQVRADDHAFELRDSILPSLVGRPGLDLPPISNGYHDKANQARLLELARRAHPADA